MNLYIIVEGIHTEVQIYPVWISYVAPNLNRIDDARNVNSNNYYLMSGNGIPSIFNHIVNAIEDVNAINSEKEQEGNHGYDYLVVGIDVEEESREEILQEIDDRLEKANVKLNNAELIVLEQKVCIETWLLGNIKVFKKNPQNQELAKLVGTYNVGENDPEDMDNLQPDRWNTKAQFHGHYLKLMFRERHMLYAKNSTEEVCKETYFNQLVNRYNETEHISTFGNWWDFFRNL